MDIDATPPPALPTVDLRSLPHGLRKYRPGVFDRFHRAGSKTLTASQVPALFGHSRFGGTYAIAAHISGKAAMDEPTEAIVERGRRLEPVSLEMVAEQKGWLVHQVKAWAPHRLLKDRFVASPDALAWKPGAVVDEAGIGECKVVADMIFAQSWQDGPPLEVELQHQAQFATTGAAWGFISALVVGTFRWDLIVYETQPNPAAIKLIEDAARNLLWLVDADQLPPPDTHPASIAALAQVYPEVDPGKVVTLAGEDAEEGAKRFELWQQAKLDKIAVKAIEEAHKNWFLAKALDAGEVRIGNDRAVTLKLRKRAGHTVAPTTYRELKLVNLQDEAA